jgi:hypothetical protein
MYIIHGLSLVRNRWQVDIYIIHGNNSYMYYTYFHNIRSSYSSVGIGISSRVKWPGRENDHSPPSSSEVKKSGAIPSLPYMTS